MNYITQTFYVFFMRHFRFFFCFFFVFQRWSLVVVVLFIFTGLFMFTYHSTQFNLEGFILVMTASVLAGMRWTLAQVVMQKNELGLLCQSSVLKTDSFKDQHCENFLHSFLFFFLFPKKQSYYLFVMDRNT